MKLKLKRSIPFLVLLILSCFLYLIFFKNAHFAGSNPMQYLWIFNENIRPEINKNISTTESRKEDTLTTYLYEDYKITIFKISEKNIDWNVNSFNIVKSFENFEKKFTGEILNKDALPFPEVWISSKMNFQSKLNFNLDEMSTVDTTFNEQKHFGLIGNIYKLGIGANNESFILFDYNIKPMRTLFLFLKKEKIIIVINSEKSFNREALKLLNPIYTH